MKHVFFIVALFAGGLAVVSAVSAIGPDKLPITSSRFKSEAAEKAIENYRATLARLQSDLDRAELRYVADLREAKRDAMVVLENLAEANAIEAEIKAVEARRRERELAERTKSNPKPATPLPPVVDPKKPVGPPEEIRALPEPSPHEIARRKLAGRIVGTVWTAGKNLEAQEQFNADGTVHALDNPERKWRWTAIDEYRAVMIFDSGGIDVVAFDAELTEMEYFQGVAPADRPRRTRTRVR